MMKAQSFTKDLSNKPRTSCFLSKPFRPEGTEVNSRGRAALREAHGSEAKVEDPESVRQSTQFDLSGSDHTIDQFRGLRAKPLAHGY